MIKQIKEWNEIEMNEYILSTMEWNRLNSHCISFNQIVAYWVCMILKQRNFHLQSCYISYMLDEVNVFRILSYCSEGNTVVSTNFDLFCVRRKYMSKHKRGCKMNTSSNGAFDIISCRRYCNSSGCNGLEEWRYQSEWHFVLKRMWTSEFRIEFEAVKIHCSCSKKHAYECNCYFVKHFIVLLYAYKI